MYNACPRTGRQMSEGAHACERALTHSRISTFAPKDVPSPRTNTYKIKDELVLTSTNQRARTHSLDDMRLSLASNEVNLEPGPQAEQCTSIIATTEDGNTTSDKEGWLPPSWWNSIPDGITSAGPDAWHSTGGTYLTLELEDAIALVQ